MKREQILRLMTHTGQPGKLPQLKETHISWVIISDKQAYKIKKPLKLSFLDFSTLQKRKYYCQREVELNSRLSSGIYLGVIEVREETKRIAFKGQGKIIDYAVMMKKLRAEKQMDHLLKYNRVKVGHIQRLAKKIIAFHQSAAIIKKDFDPEVLKNTFNDILPLTDFLGRHLHKETNQIITEAVKFSDQFIDKNKSLFLQREREGMVRDVHGDLHSGNIFLYYHPIIFDCIEFNDNFRQIDVLNDIAFFCMDMEAFGRNDLSGKFLDLYRQKTGFIKSPADLELFRYYQLYRASVRAKVLALKAQQDGDDPHWKKEVMCYLELMKAYLSAVAV